jgi:2-isopropylmalate synthase
VGIHAHNDSDVAVANSLAAVRAGCVQVQGTINGYGERCGNANLISIIPILQLKMGIPCVPDESLAGLTQLSRKISGIANMNADNHAPFVGASSFAHKGGIHVSAIEKTPLSYEHIEPIRVGNQRKVVISELSGAGNIRARASELGFSIKGDEAPLLNRIKNLEAKGFQFENAEGSFELMLHKLDADYQAPFEIIDIMEVSEQRSDRNMAAKAMCKIRVAENVFHTAADGDGPVHAIDNAMRKALIPAFPEIADVRLADYKVRILDPENTTGATTRVTIQARANGDIWTTVGCSSNIIEASWHALCDSYELFIIRRRSL